MSSAALLPTPLLMCTSPLSTGLPVLRSTSAAYNGLVMLSGCGVKSPTADAGRRLARGAHVAQHPLAVRQVLADHPAVVDAAVGAVAVLAGAVPLVVELAHHVGHRLVDRARLVEVEQARRGRRHAVGQLVRHDVVGRRESRRRTPSACRPRRRWPSGSRRSPGRRGPSRRWCRRARRCRRGRARRGRSRRRQRRCRTPRSRRRRSWPWAERPLVTETGAALPGQV